MRDADVLGLAAVDGVAEKPPARGAVGVHGFTAKLAGRAGRHAGQQNVVADLVLGHRGPGLFDDADAFVA